MYDLTDDHSSKFMVGYQPAAVIQGHAGEGDIQQEESGADVCQLKTP